jgi:hypothetical protein
MRILIVDQCSGSKAVPDWFTPYDEQTIAAHTREELLHEVRDRVPARRAERLYQGRQQQYITEACDRLRSAGDTVDRVFISAGFGVVDETTELPPYEVTFTDRSAEAVRERGTELGIEANLRTRLVKEEPYDVVFFALGQAYLNSFDLEALLSEIPDRTGVVVFNHEAVAERFGNVYSLSARTAEAKELGTIVVALKGRYLQNFAAHRAQGTTVNSIAEAAEYCRSEPTSQSKLNDT